MNAVKQLTDDVCALRLEVAHCDSTVTILQLTVLNTQTLPEAGLTHLTGLGVRGAGTDSITLHMHHLHVIPTLLLLAIIGQV